MYLGNKAVSNKFEDIEESKVASNNQIIFVATKSGKKMAVMKNKAYKAYKSIHSLNYNKKTDSLIFVVEE